MRQEALNLKMMKRLTTPKLLVLLAGSLLLLAGLIAVGNMDNPTSGPGVVEIVLFTALLLTVIATLATSAILACRFFKRIGAQKFILLCGAVVFVLIGLFPPWLYTYDVTATHSRSNAGCSFILSPPLPRGNNNDYGIQIDMSRLLIEWACVLAAIGAAWMIFIPRKPTKEQRKEKNDPLALN